MKLALGSAQLGMSYGAFNRAGQPSNEAVRDVLAQAAAGGIDLIDTASAYGTSEQVLGELGASDRFAIVTKVPALTNADPLRMLDQTFRQSLAHLRSSSVYGLLLHRAADLLGGDGPAIWRTMEGLREAGLVGRIGFSGYEPAEALELLNRYPVDIVQLPLNVFDHRHVDAGVLERCDLLGVEVHVRSAFLQGFALADLNGLDSHLAAWRGVLEAFRARCYQLALTPLEGALRHIIDLPAIDRVVVGVDSAEQLQEILRAAVGPALPADAWTGLQCDDRDLLDPSRWN